MFALVRWTCFSSLLLVMACNQEPEVELSQASPSSSPLALKPDRRVLDRIFASSTDCSAEGQESSAPAQIRRLTRDEYDRTVSDLFSVSLNLQSQLPPDESLKGFRNNALANVVSVDHAVAYGRAAVRVADALLSQSWENWAGCSVFQGRACAEQVIEQQGPRIWRRPLISEERQALLSVYDNGAQRNQEEGIRLLIKAFLSAPTFLYRSEIGRDGQLDAYEWASALSYFFWGSTPDDALLARAADGSILNDATLETEIDRLLRSPKAREGVKAFAAAWTGYRQVLEVAKDSSRFPRFDSAMRVRLAQETEDFFTHLVLEKDGLFPEIFLADYSWGDNTLAQYYGADWGLYQGRGRLDLTKQERRGILGHASLLASLAYSTETSPIRRGVFVREHFLCEEMPPPPPNLNIQPPPPREGATTRERFAAHTASPTCKGCHLRIDGVGFGMEDFDAVGLFRSQDNGKLVDRTGQLFDTDGVTRNFQGALELSRILAESPRAQRCFVVQWYRMAQGRFETAADVCAIRSISERFERGQNLRELMISIITHPSYRQRSL